MTLTNYFIGLKETLYDVITPWRTYRHLRSSGIDWWGALLMTIAFVPMILVMGLVGKYRTKG